ncbi:G2/mitotic-specific cyclin-A [Toxocara canis]|uniref:G2/mitotic-specific cyclin-A n=2 Tax=Toxocara canis TaxID=6265 RepID=A0A0B2UVM4_TOXCA|nr:G2/mitotic-specific cyclin-A [Toxocara canis]
MASNGAMSRIAPSGARQVSKKEHTSSSLSYRNININNEGTGEKNNLEKVASTAPQVIASNQHAVPVVSHMVKATFSVYTDDEEAGDGYENRHLTATRPSLRKPLADITLQTSFSQFSETTVENVESLSESSDGRTAVESVAVSSSSMIADTTVSEDSLYGSVNDENSEYHTAPMTLSDKERDSEQALCSPVYMDDIYKYMRKRELRIRPRMHYMSKQSDINAEMRHILVDWLADVVTEYDLQLETFHLTVSLIDRTLSTVDCPRLKLQLVGAAAIMVAAKCEEIYPPPLKEYVYITDDTFTASQILRMERVVLSAVNLDVSAPTSNWFGLRLTRMAHSDKHTISAMNYLLELALLDYTYLKYRASVLGAAAFCLANILTGPTPWPTAIEEDTGITVADMIDVLEHLLRSFHDASKMTHKAIYEKYCDEKFHSVALIVAPKSLPAVR